MKNGIINKAWQMLLVLILASAFAHAQRGAGSAPPKSPAPQKLGDRFEIRVTGLRTATEWKMFGDFPGMPTAKPKAGETLLIVTFGARDLKTGKPDTDASFKDFVLEDQAGNKHAASVAMTDLREMAFSIPPTAKPRAFHIAGLTFDISGMAIK